MISLDFYSKYPKESKRITLFFLVMVIVSVLFGIIHSKSKKSTEKAKPDTEKRQPTPKP
jgi:hypothetical protein